MITSDVIALSALLLSVFSMIGSAIVYISGLRRERRTATLNAFNVLQEQVLDHLNLHQKARGRDIRVAQKRGIQAAVRVSCQTGAFCGRHQHRNL